SIENGRMVTQNSALKNTYDSTYSIVKGLSTGTELAGNAEAMSAVTKALSGSLGFSKMPIGFGAEIIKQELERFGIRDSERIASNFMDAYQGNKTMGAFRDNVLGLSDKEAKITRESLGITDEAASDVSNTYQSTLSKIQSSQAVKQSNDALRG